MEEKHSVRGDSRVTAQTQPSPVKLSAPLFSTYACACYICTHIMHGTAWACGKWGGGGSVVGQRSNDPLWPFFLQRPMCPPLTCPLSVALYPYSFAMEMTLTLGAVRIAYMMAHPREDRKAWGIRGKGASVGHHTWQATVKTELRPVMAEGGWAAHPRCGTLVEERGGVRPPTITTV